MATDLPPGNSLRSLLEKYLGKTVGVNIDKTHHIDAALLIAVHDDFFTLRSSGDGHLHHVTYANIVQVIEDDNGVEIAHLFTANERFDLVIKIGHVVAYTPA